MTRSEREMVRPLDQPADQFTDHQPTTPAAERFTSLQPTYEDSVAPTPDDEWFEED